MGFFKDFTKALTDPMTYVIAAAALVTGGGSLTWAAFATRVAITAALQASSVALAGKPDFPDFSSFAQNATNRTRMIKQPITSRRAIYGELRVSGVIGHMETTSDDKFLHIIVMVASHELNSIGTIYLNDEAITLDVSGNATAPSKYAGKVRIKTHLGASNQTADVDLVAESESGWTADHRLQGIAYIYARLEFNANSFPNGIPNISALVQGKKVFDPRTSATNYSTNPALVIRDYLTDTVYGFGATSSEINDTSFTTAANICEESIALSAGGTENKYTANGSVDAGQPPKQILEDLMTSCGGILTYSNGKFELKAAKYVTPTITIDEDDIIGGIDMQTRKSRRDNYNAIKGIFTPPETNYIPTDYPVYSSDTFIEEDGAEQIFLDYDLPFTTSASMAQRLAKIALFRNRQQIVLQLECNLKAFNLKVGDTVNFTNSRFGFSNKVFEVASWDLTYKGGALGVSLALQELNSAVFDWDAEEVEFQIDNTTLPSPFDLTPPTVLVTDELQAFNQKAVSVLIVNVSSGSIYANQFEVQAKKTSETDYISLGISSSEKFELIDVQDNVTYDVRARIISSFGTTSEYQAEQHQVVGKTAPPVDVTNFSVNIIGSEASLSWTPSTDLDLSHYIVRHARETSGASYQNAITLVDKISRPANTAVVPAMTGTYFIKAVDKLGNASLNATSSVAIIEGIKGFNLVETSTQHPNFTGTKTNIAVVDNALILDTDINFEDVTGNFDDAVGLFDGGGGNVSPSGTYEFDNYVDLGSVYTSHVTASLNVIRQTYVDLFDSTQGLFDDGVGDFDGDVQPFDDTNVELQIATTESDPAASPVYTDFRKFFVGDYKARAFKFRAIMTSSDAEASPKITALSVTVDMPDRTVAEADVVSGAGSKAITFSPSFKSLQGVGIAAQNLSSGDYYVISSKSATGFTITFYNSSDSAVNRTFDYVARGFGELAA